MTRNSVPGEVTSYFSFEGSAMPLIAVKVLSSQASTTSREIGLGGFGQLREVDMCHGTR
jgi:hypothetical protein